jgi:stress response protein YsnF
VERHPVDRPVGLSDTEAFKESVIELSETAEEVVASKEAQVVEEAVVSKGVTEHAETVKDTVRRTEVEVEKLPPGQAGHPPKRTP